MADSPFKTQADAYRALGTLMEQAQLAWELFQKAGIPTPPPLARLIGELGEPEEKELVIPPMPTPPRPPEYQSGWVFIPLYDLMAGSLVKGVLRSQAGKPILPASIFSAIEKYLPVANLESVLKVGRREVTAIAKGPAGWTLVDPDIAPVFHEDYGWGPSDVFTVHEVATYRRQIVRHILAAAAPEGASIVQVARALEKMPDFKLPVSRDTIAGDFAALARDGQVIQDESAKRWSLVDSQEERPSDAT